MGGAEPCAKPLLATATSSPGHFASVTVVGVVPQDPENVFRIFSRPGEHCVFSDVKSVKEVGRTRARPQGSSRHLVSEVEVEQVAAVNVLRVPINARMTVRLSCNHTTKQARRLAAAAGRGGGFHAQRCGTVLWLWLGLAGAVGGTAGRSAWHAASPVACAMCSVLTCCCTSQLLHPLPAAA